MSNLSICLVCRVDGLGGACFQAAHLLACRAQSASSRLSCRMPPRSSKDEIRNMDHIKYDVAFIRASREHARCKASQQEEPTLRIPERELPSDEAVHAAFDALLDREDLSHRCGLGERCLCTNRPALAALARQTSSPGQSHNTAACVQPICRGA